MILPVYASLGECIRTLVLYMYWVYLGRHIYRSLAATKEELLYEDLHRRFLQISESSIMRTHAQVHSVWIPVVLLSLRYFLTVRSLPFLCWCFVLCASLCLLGRGFLAQGVLAYDYVRLHLCVQKVFTDSYPKLTTSEVGVQLLERADNLLLAVLDKNRLHSTITLFDGTR